MAGLNAFIHNTFNLRSLSLLCQAKEPAQKRTAKPVTMSGFHWRKNGAGWDLRKDIYVEENGVRKRRQPYLAHLSKEAFSELKKRHRGAALEKGIAQWIAEHEK